MQVDAVRDAYSAAASQYVALFDRLGPADEQDAAFVRRHLTGLTGPVLDLGCGPGQWSAHLHEHGADVTGVDVVPELVAHAEAAHPGPRFRLGSMTDLGLEDAAGVLSWYSTIHVPPAELGEVLAGFRRLLRPDGVLVLGFFDSDTGVMAFDHAVVTAYRWPTEVLAEHLAQAGFREVERLLQLRLDRPDRRYGAIAARAS